MVDPDGGGAGVERSSGSGDGSSTGGTGSDGAGSDGGAGGGGPGGLLASEEQVYASRGLASLVDEATAQPGQDPGWEHARQALVAALEQAERLGAANCPGRLGRRNWSARLL